MGTTDGLGAARALGRRTAQSIQQAAANNSTQGVKRTRGVITAVHNDGTCDVELGSSAHSMILENLTATVGCASKMLVGSTAIVDTYDHVSVITGILANGTNTSASTWQRYSLPNMSAVGKWLKLGWWSGSNDSNSLIIDLYTGNGYNGRAYQNVHARIMVKNGAETIASNMFAGTLQIVAGAGETTAGAMKIALPASSTTNCDVYVYMPWMYARGWMEVACNGGKWNFDVKEQDYPTSGYTLQPVDYTGIVASRVASPGGMTIAANNASSNVTLNNTVFGNNSMNTTTGVIDNLWWDSTLLGGRVGLKLWSGTLSKGGSITVTHLNRFRVLYLTTSWAPSIKAIGINNNDSAKMSFCTGFNNGTSYQMVFLFTKTAGNAGNGITYTCGSYHNLGGTSEADTLQVTGIWGLI